MSTAYDLFHNLKTTIITDEIGIDDGSFTSDSVDTDGFESFLFTFIMTELATAAGDLSFVIEESDNDADWTQAEDRLVYRDFTEPVDLSDFNADTRTTLSIGSFSKARFVRLVTTFANVPGGPNGLAHALAIQGDPKSAPAVVDPIKDEV